MNSCGFPGQFLLTFEKVKLVQVFPDVFGGTFSYQHLLSFCEDEIGKEALFLNKSLLLHGKFVDKPGLVCCTVHLQPTAIAFGHLRFADSSPKIHYCLVKSSGIFPEKQPISKTSEQLLTFCRVHR